MSKKELDDAIFHMKRPERPGFKAGPPQFVSTGVPATEEGEALCFDIAGNWTADQKRCAAKSVKGIRGTRFFVKFCTDGPDKGHLLNPYSIYFREGDDIALVPRRGQAKYEFRTCSQAAFENYLQFLKTKTFVFCQRAEREILNA